MDHVMGKLEASQMFGERVRRKRLMCGLNQRQLAERLGTLPPHVSKIESGTLHAIGIAELRRLLVELRTSAEYLLGLSNDPGEIPERYLSAVAV